MNCFNHREQPALGICKSCGKALCGDCLVERKNGLACKGSCEDRVDMADCFLDTSSKNLSAAQRNVRIQGAVSLVMGIAFLVSAVWTYFEGFGFLPYFLGVLGVLTLLSGISGLNRREQHPQIKEPRR